MPYVRDGKCVYKENPDKTKGRLVGCSKDEETAKRYMRALYAHMKKETEAMAKAKTREKRRERRLRAAQIAKAKVEEFEQEPIEEEELEVPEDEPLTEEEVALLEEEVETKVAELEEIGEEITEEPAEFTWNTKDLVYNMTVTRLPEPSEDMELLELEAMIAKENRSMSVGEKIWGFIVKEVLDADDRKKLPEDEFALPSKRKYPVNDKAHVRNALARAAQMIKRGGEAAKDARAALPKIREAAKKMGIGMQKDRNAVVIEKDAIGRWRAVMWPSNNFKDLDGEIISEKAHLEYVDWVNKNMDCAPAFVTWHKPGTARMNRVDFVAYENGFLIMSAPLTEKEAAGLFRAQKLTDLGMSHGSFVLERNGNVIEKYRMVEVSDLPLEHAANPFTDFEILTKEADMDTKKYLAEILGSEEKAEAYLSKTGMKQAALREADVEEKEVKEEKTPEPVATAPAPAADKDAIVAQVLKELDIEGLQGWIAKANEALEKVPVLEELVKELSTSNENKLAEMISPNAEKRFLWSKARATENPETVVKEGDPLKENLPALPDEWANAFGVTPLTH